MGDSVKRRESFEGKNPVNQPWGTVLKRDDMQLGKRKVSKEEVDAITERLTSPTGKGHKPPPDSNRTGALKEVGIQNSYAWKGW